MSQWQPSASIENLKKRAEILRLIRQFFLQRNVLEVETPCLSAHTVTDVHLESFMTQDQWGNQFHLQTSPEFAMKRLLAAGSGSIYQICKSFRNEDCGRHHNPEFTMLEWYRTDFDMFQLMAEVDGLLQQTLGCGKSEYISYRQVFLDNLDIDPFDTSWDALVKLCDLKGHGSIAKDETCIDTLLQLLFSFEIEPKLGTDRPVSVYHFPASQSALAKLCPNDSTFALRFEFYFKGIELANGFEELDDAQEQLQRFVQDNAMRSELGRVQKEIDHLFLEALQHGLPSCSGVALGVDRLLMLATNASHINQVISFDKPRA